MDDYWMEMEQFWERGEDVGGRWPEIPDEILIENYEYGRA